MAGTLIADTLTSSGGNSASMDEVVQGCAKAWVNFNGTGTIAIRDSFNVSSITDRAVGQWTVNFTTAMPNANYVVSGMTSTDAATNRFLELDGTSTALTTTAVLIALSVTTGVQADSSEVCVLITGD